MKTSSADKYSEAVSLYKTTRLSVREICEQTQMPFIAFCNYLSRHHRDLMLKREGLHELENVKLRGCKGQTTASHLKYREAIVAADSEAYIEYNISQIARLFGLDGTALANQLRRHYPDILPRREQERRRLGISDNVHRGVRQWCAEGYAEAVRMLRETDLTIEEVARACEVSRKGLLQHITAYHHDLMAVRDEKRRSAMKRGKILGERTGGWSIHKPNAETLKKYAAAIELYEKTSLPITEIANREGLNAISLGAYIRRWFPELVARRHAPGYSAVQSAPKH